MVVTTIPPVVLIEPMKCDSAAAANSTLCRFAERKSWHEMMGHVFKSLSYDDDDEGVNNDLIEELDDNDSIEELLDMHSIFPTPITAKREHVTIVKEIKLGSWWTNHNDDDFSADLLKELLLDEQQAKKVPEESSSSSINCMDTACTSQEDREGSYSAAEEDEGESSNCTLNTHEASAIDRGDKWNQRLHELLKYRDEMGHCLVPHNWKGNRSLAQWVKRQRYQFKLKCEGKHSTLSDDRMKLLKKVGFIWSRHGASWEERYTELAEFAELHGHCNVPSNYPENHKLSVWVRCQRRQYKLRQCKKTSTMTPERIVRLNRLGFLFNPRNVK